MKTIKCSLTTLMLLVATMTFAQDVNLKKGIVYVDDKECLKYEGKENPGYTFTNQAGDELFFIGFASDYKGTYWRVTFLKQKTKMTYRVAFISKKAFIQRMVKDGLLNNCNLNEEKLENFIAKYNERIE